MYGSQEDNVLGDRIVSGVSVKCLQERKAFAICKADEVSKTQTLTIQDQCHLPLLRVTVYS